MSAALIIVALLVALVLTDSGRSRA